MIVDQLLDAVMRDQEVAAPDETRAGCARSVGKTSWRCQSAPDRLQLQDALQGGIAGIVSAVQGADTGADHHIGGNSVRGERMHHAHLNGAEAASAREHEGGFRPADPGWIRTRPRSLPVSTRRQSSRGVRASVIAAERQAAPSIVGVGYMPIRAHRTAVSRCIRAIAPGAPARPE